MKLAQWGHLLVSRVGSESIPHIWIVPGKLHRTDTGSSSPGKRGQCDALGLPCGRELWL